MQEDAMEKLRSGSTTLEEILRVVPARAYLMRMREVQPAYPVGIQVCPYCGTEWPKDPRTSAGGTGFSCRRSPSNREGTIGKTNVAIRQDVRYPQLTELSMIYEGATEEVAVRPPRPQPARYVHQYG